MYRVAVALLSVFVSSISYAVGPSITDCPSEFHSIAVHNNAKLCQVFDTGLPASMVYHVDSSPNNIMSLILEDSRMQFVSNVQSRILLMSKNKQYRVVVSPDGEGSQVDILITSL